MTTLKHRFAPLAALFIFALFCLTLLCSASPALAQDSDSLMDDLREYSDLIKETRGPSYTVAAKFAELTGVSASPLLGLCVMGGIKMLNTPKNKIHHLPWYQHPGFLVPALILLLAVAFKDTVGEVLGPFKAPLDHLDMVQTQAAAVLAYLVILPEFIDALQGSIGGGTLALLDCIAPVSAAWAADAAAGGGFSAGIETFAAAVAAVVGTFVFALVWLASSAVNMLMLIAPVPFVGAVLKSIRMGVVAVLAAATAIHPFLGAFVALLIIYISYRLAGWSFRLGFSALLFSWDTVFLRGRGAIPAPEKGVKAFSASALSKAPRRSYGRLKHGETGLEFAYRPWLVLPRRRVPVMTAPGRLSAAKALMSPAILAPRSDSDGYTPLVKLPPRYAGKEAEIARLFGLSSEVRNISVTRGFGAAFRWIKTQFSGEDETPRTEAVQT